MSNIKSPNRTILIKRLFCVLEQQIVLLEKDMANHGNKEVTLLGTITRNLEKLIDLDQKERERKPDKKRTRELNELRQKLSDRIEHLRRG
ncbi:MAG: hypothetical protein L3J15_08785 [Devosiaceae bacterium]|nr:hypothetical protein [Devosiaceae bacterium]